MSSGRPQGSPTRVRQIRRGPNRMRARTGYTMFLREQYPDYKREHPEATPIDFGADMGELWRNMSAEEKQPYEEEAARMEEEKKTAVSRIHRQW